MDKVKVVPNQEFEGLFPKFQPSRVTITTTSSRSFSTRVDVPKGDPRDPMTEQEIAVKFHALGDGVLSRDDRDKLAQSALSTLPLIRTIRARVCSLRSRCTPSDSNHPRAFCCMAHQAQVGDVEMRVVNRLCLFA